MGSDPPVSRSVPLPLVPSKRLIYLGQRLDFYLRGTPDEPWLPLSVEHHHEIAGLRHWFAIAAVIAYYAGGGPLDPGDDQIGQFGRHLRAVAKRPNDIIVVIEPGVTAKILPEGIRLRGSQQHVYVRRISTSDIDPLRLIPEWSKAI